MKKSTENNLKYVVYSFILKENDIFVNDIYFSKNSFYVSTINYAKIFKVTKRSILYNLNTLKKEGLINDEENSILLEIPDINNRLQLTRLYDSEVFNHMCQMIRNRKISSKFLKWSSKIVKQVINTGFYIDDHIIEQHPENIRKLDEAIRLRKYGIGAYKVFTNLMRDYLIDYDKKNMTGLFVILYRMINVAITGLTKEGVICERLNSDAEKNYGKISSITKKYDNSKEYYTDKELKLFGTIAGHAALKMDFLVDQGSKLTRNEIIEIIQESINVFGLPTEPIKKYSRKEMNEKLEQTLKLIKK